MLRRFGEGDFAGVITVTRGEDATKGGLNFFDEQFCLKRLGGKTVTRTTGAVASRRLAQAQRTGLV